MHNLYLYGPPGSGKTTLGKLLSERLALEFLDLDRFIQNDAGMPVKAIFAAEGEEGFRAREKRALAEVAACDRAVVALGGGTLLDTENRALAEESGTVVCLDCPIDILRTHIDLTPGTRPLVNNGISDSGVALEALMEKRASHYASFRRRLDVAGRSLDSLVDAAEILFGSYRIATGDVPSDVVVGENILGSIGGWAQARDLGCRCVVVCDGNTHQYYGERVMDSMRAAGIQPHRCVIPAGEGAKTLATVQDIWKAFMQAELGRGDFAVAVGGGVTGDLTGFAAATWMRGMRWVNVPTTLLAMVDASTGGKTGCDLPGAKNMVGAFHSPSLVAADVETLLTLPAGEWRCGLAEMVKHALIGDADLATHFDFFDGLRPLADDATWDDFADLAGLAAFVSRALAVKVHIVREDPREKGIRAKLNLGHTVGHAVETLTDYRVRHGEAVAIGTVEEARLAVRLGHASADWPDKVAALFAGVGLPTTLPDGLSFDSLREVMRRDKKRSGNTVRFALPCAPGDVVLVPVEL
ncbi:MAG: 3-dehydroquinate synthase [Kiritimatiellae bacterium]|nr:3-dehydroquinate synthase [Kiritimatiellia bacterium]